jgi:hypothetical protein
MNHEKYTEEYNDVLNQELNVIIKEENKQRFEFYDIIDKNYEIYKNKTSEINSIMAKMKELNTELENKINNFFIPNENNNHAYE